jgi:transcriptional regulator with XRE-family HTH domain
MDPAAILRAARIRRGLTQAGLAARAGTSQPVISAYEHGRRDPTTGTLRRLVAAAGEHLELRLAPAPPPVPPPVGFAEHAARLIDVLLLADAIPTRSRPPTTWPRMVSSP